NIHRDYAQVDLHHPVDEGEDEEEAWPSRAYQAAQAEDHPTLILLDHLDGEKEQRKCPDVRKPGKHPREPVWAGNALRGLVVVKLSLCHALLLQLPCGPSAAGRGCG